MFDWFKGKRHIKLQTGLLTRSWRETIVHEYYEFVMFNIDREKICSLQKRLRKIIVEHVLIKIIQLIAN